MQRRQSSAVLVAERQSIIDKIECLSSDDCDVCLYVIVLNGLTQNITIKWLLQLFEKPSKQSGGQFIVKRILDPKESDSESEITFHVSASNRKT